MCIPVMFVNMKYNMSGAHFQPKSLPIPLGEGKKTKKITNYVQFSVFKWRTKLDSKKCDSSKCVKMIYSKVNSISSNPS